MATMRSIITAALRRLGANSANAVPTAEDTDVCLQAMNSLIDSMSNDLLNIHTITPYRYLLNPLQQTYKLGPALDVNGVPTGADWVVDRPMRIESAILLVYPSVSYATGPVSLYTHFVSMRVADGSDGDVGVKGYIAETEDNFNNGTVFSPATAIPQTDEIPNWFGSQTLGQVMTSVGFDNQLYVGGGDATTPVPTMSPMPIQTRSVFNNEYGFYLMFTLMPARAGDSLWVTNVLNLNYGGPVVMEVVVGPTATEGEVYRVGMTGGEPYDRTISIERLANVGGRT